MLARPWAFGQKTRLPPCHLVDQLVHLLPTVPFDPAKLDSPFALFDERQQGFPKVLIGYWLSLGVLPSPLLPTHPPSLQETIGHVCRIRNDRQRPLQGPHCLQDGSELHPLVGSAGLPTTCAPASSHGPGPSSRTGVPKTSPVGVDDRPARVGCALRANEKGQLAVLGNHCAILACLWPRKARVSATPTGRGGHSRRIAQVPAPPWNHLASSGKVRVENPGK
jgi:hypothetical protein